MCAAVTALIDRTAEFGQGAVLLVGEFSWGVKSGE